MEFQPHSLGEVLAVAKIHPFYVEEIQYPPDEKTVQSVRERVAAEQEQANEDLKKWPVIWKKDLYDTIQRLINDTDPNNTYRQSVYASITGGGFGSKPLFFGTDVYENRKHRAHFGQFLKTIGAIKPGDWALTTHCAGELYRSLDLMLEIMENAGASVLSAGNFMPPKDVAKLLAKYHINVLAGDSGQIVQMVHHISTLPEEERALIRLDKLIYTSEVLTAAQRAHIKATLKGVKIISVLGSAEAGPWAASSPDIVGKESTTSVEDLIFDTRAMLLEVLPASFAEGDKNVDPLPDGETGVVVQTSLSRLRNPLVRYVTGDIGSVHPLPEEARDKIPAADWPYLRILRLQGRDRRVSFDWDGEYIQFEDMAALLNNEECGILQWQIILDKLEPSLESFLEIRLMCSPRTSRVLSLDALIARIKGFLHVIKTNDYRFKTTFVNELDGFVRSTTGRKVIKFVNRYN
ncbi:hypothetical protein N5P37_011108 [Trichoderma harzianum]|uniref:AMP-dependent synthetase/ligase domain-containing protein n=1 Tax=Trichoderma harzianum CBS 226.95 TaxID=983964 RepID=A0A2T3ZVS5_TRIHA|nr:hypothetical protein M431DRAFT_10585 [Trichoderma harzianum CBS 226.95]KAK0756455.1 hypothetical protein N5P37_011108 [Trichoderma harzianum]PKK46323.1 hypothetical protein CI102_9803 [Trichoderma harzianum]PTB48912.1 hypothetical protein M431DRAFT_10585 [Trichoderma harzianum CBS 226.95]